MYLKKAFISGSVVASVVGWIAAGSSFAASPDDLIEAAKSSDLAILRSNLITDATASGRR